MAGRTSSAPCSYDSTAAVDALRTFIWLVVQVPSWLPGHPLVPLTLQIGAPAAERAESPFSSAEFTRSPGLLQIWVTRVGHALGGVGPVRIPLTTVRSAAATGAEPAFEPYPGSMSPGRTGECRDGIPSLRGQRTRCAGVTGWRNCGSSKTWHRRNPSPAWTVVGPTPPIAGHCPVTPGVDGLTETGVCIMRQGPP